MSPSAFWSSNGHRQLDFYRPVLFEYRTDEFMEAFLAAAAAQKTDDLVAARLPQLANATNKLFQPVHGCFYLAAASLCCREPGFPDRAVRQADGEVAGFVLRKLVDSQEYGWVVQPAAKGWQPLTGTGRTLLTDEERLPLFPVSQAGGRQLYCAYVPVSSSDTYNVPPSEFAVDGVDLDLPVQELGSRFTTPLTRNQGPNDPDLAHNLVDALDDDIALTTSVFLVVELLEFLRQYLGAVAAAIENPATAAPFTGDQAQAEQALVDFLNTQAYKGTLSLGEALQAVAAKYTELNAPQADPSALGFGEGAYSLKNSTDLDDQALEDLLALVADALPTERPAFAMPKLEIAASVRYVLRFVFERTLCDPVVVEISQQSQPFVFAPFFDPDAPARSIRIALPSDVSIGGIRKFKKGVTFVMSDAMRKKMESIVGKERAMLLDPQPSLSEDSGGIAFICSFSIQIIFMIAFMLLLIFVVVFNIVFWWLIFFKICLPVPKKWLPE